MPKPFSSKERALYQSLQEFVAWVGEHINGYEKGEAPIFLDRFFQCFGYEGVIEAGGQFEVAIANASLLENTGRIDCLFKDVALFEMKSLHQNLNKHYRQLRDYWREATPKPRYAILCNFQEFWIYDFNKQMGEPVQKLTVKDFPNHFDKLAFMAKGREVEIDFEINSEAITKKTVEELKHFYDTIVESNKLRKKLPLEDIQHFVLQCMLCMFAEDIGLIPPHFFTNLVEKCKKTPEDSYDILNGLFEHMDNPTPSGLGRFKEIAYFNGGLFAKRIPIELMQGELQFLWDMARKDWRPIEPAIFGTIFEIMIDKKVRNADGVHYTNEQDMEKIIRPTITEYWKRKGQAATGNAEAIKTLIDEIRQYRVLDPACGSGNFLYKALIELKEIEHAFIEEYKTLAPAPVEEAYTHGAVGSHQLFGLDKNHFAVELAKLSLEIGRKKAVDKLGLNETVLPLNNLQDNLICTDALFTEWPEADAIIGNPPFLGSRNFRREGMTDNYISNMHSLYPDDEFPNSADLCAYWFRKAQDHVATRCGLVATDSIAEGVSRKASLSFIVENGGIIHNAIKKEAWSGEAKTNVSFVNWTKIYDCDPVILDGKPVDISIGSSLTIAESKLTSANQLKQNKNICFQGIIPLGRGFVISNVQAMKWIQQDAKNAEVVKPYISGDPLTEHPELKPERWLIDFNAMPIEQASAYTDIFDHIKTRVKPIREQNRRESLAKYWWHHGEKRPAMRQALKDLEYYFVLPRLSKWGTFVTIAKENLPGDVIAVCSDDYYVLGILNSNIHIKWVRLQSASRGSGIRYDHTSCFNTFPFLWNAPETAKEAVRAIATELDAFRLNTMKERNIGLTQLYNQFFNEPTSQLAKLHAKLDKAVCEQVYGWPYSPDKNYNPELFELNQLLATTST
jgi:SAM-dependent methyltransferase